MSRIFCKCWSGPFCILFTLFNTIIMLRRKRKRVSSGMSRFFWIFACVIGLSILFQPTTSPAQTHPLAYIPNYNSTSVSVIDTATNTVTATIGVGSKFCGVAVSTDGTRVYITNDINNVVSVIDTASNTVIATIPTGRGSAGVAIAPDGANVYVTNYWARTVSVIDAATNAVTATISSGIGSNPYGVAVSPDGRRVYVANTGSDSVSVIDTSTNTVTATIGVYDQPRGIAVSPDGTEVYVGNFGSRRVSIISTATNRVTTTLSFGGQTVGIAFTPDGTTAYVANYNGFVAAIDTDTHHITTISAGGNAPWGIAVTPDGTRAYVGTYGSRVLVINTATNTVLTNVTVQSTPLAFGNSLPIAYLWATSITTTVTDITATTATSGGTVTYDGGSAVIERGVCYGTSPKPTTPCTSDGSGTGSFTSSLTGLTPSTTYYVRAYATNASGTSYGNEVSFTTGPTVTINQAAGQDDPTDVSPINFTAVFSGPVTDFATGDVTLSGTAGATTATVTEIAPNDGMTYNVAVSGMTSSGTVIATIDVGVASGNMASTSTDNTVIYNHAPTDLTLSNSSVTEGEPSGTPVGPFSTTDADAGDMHSYTLLTSGCSGSYPDSASFTIGGASSDELLTAAVFDYETQSGYDICVQTDDGNGGTYEKAFTITVTNINEPQPTPPPIPTEPPQVVVPEPMTLSLLIIGLIGLCVFARKNMIKRMK